VEFSSLSPEIQRSLMSGCKLITHASAPHDMHISTAVEIQIYRTPDEPVVKMLCHACAEFADDGTYHLIPVKPPSVEIPSASMRLELAAMLARRNYASVLRGNRETNQWRSGVEWAEMLFAIEHGYERRMADPEEWDAFEEELHSSTQAFLVAEHEKSFADVAAEQALIDTGHHPIKWGIGAPESVQ
jgi:hypothetical protein